LGPAFGQQALALAKAAFKFDHIEIAGLAQAADDRARECRMIVDFYGQRQVARIVVDRIAEDHQLDDREHEHHRHGSRIAHHLAHLLEDHGGDPLPHRLSPPPPNCRGPASSGG
jgi:hypothetical protein